MDASNDTNTITTRLELVLRNTEEIINTDELSALLTNVKEPSVYVGFEPSGLVHIGWYIIVQKLLDLADAGFKCIILLADWHAYINDKYDGDIEKIRVCARYLQDCFRAFGIDETRTQFVLGSELIDSHIYWEKVLRIAKHTTLARLRRAMTIMGRRDDETILDAAKFFYPAMQVADIFELNVHVALGGMDQRKAHMLARDIAEKLHWRKPIALHTPLLLGLQQQIVGSGGSSSGTISSRKLNTADIIDIKMSKSIPESCLYIHDSPETIERKLRRAYCPERLPEGNPIIELCRLIIFPKFEKLEIERAEKYGGNITIESFDELVEIYRAGKLHPLDLKNAVANYLNRLLQPVRDYFRSHPENYLVIKDIEPTR